MEGKEIGEKKEERKKKRKKRVRGRLLTALASFTPRERCLVGGVPVGGDGGGSSGGWAVDVVC